MAVWDAGLLVRNRGFDGLESVVELGAQPKHDGDDGNRNAGGDKAVFYGGSAGLVLQEGGDLIHRKLNSVLEDDDPRRLRLNI